MKTNQILERKMGTFKVFQRTQDGMFNATALLRQWNGNSGQQKQMIHYTENRSTEEFINALISEENLKERKSVLIKTRGKSGGTWMHPLLFIDFAMWLNPAFKVKVLKFVYDQLIQYRNEAGTEYIEMCSAVKSITPEGVSIPETITKVARAINYVVYGDHKKNMRNKVGEEQKMRELVELQKDISKLIRKKFITNPKQLRSYLVQEYRERNEPKIMQAM